MREDRDHMFAGQTGWYSNRLMPVKVDKEEALRRLARLVPAGHCPMCHLVENDEPLLESAGALLVLNRFPLRWGHLMVVTRRHVTSFEGLSPAEHAEASALVYRAACLLERIFNPVRVFTASLGTGRSDIPMSSPHQHWQVVPTNHEGERPSDVLTWSNGVVVGTDEEWAALRASLDDF